MLLSNQVENQEEIFRIEQEERVRKWQLETYKHFSSWAFGPDYETLPEIYWVDRWNQRHGHRLFLPLEDDLEVSTAKMINLYGQIFGLI
jgi:hypothetical protein